MSQTNKTSSQMQSGLGQTQQQNMNKESSAIESTNNTYNTNEAEGISPTQRTTSSKSEGQSSSANKSRERSATSQGLLGQARDKLSHTWGSGSHKDKSSSNQSKGGLAAAGLATQGNSAGGTFGYDDDMARELNTQAAISDDVFSDGVAGKTATKGMGQGLPQKSGGQTSKPKSNATEGTAAQKASQASKQYQQGGISQIAAGQGINKGALGQSTSNGMSTGQTSKDLSSQGGITRGGMAAMSGSASGSGFSGFSGVTGSGLKQQDVSQRGLQQGAFNREQTTGSTTGVSSNRVVQNLSGSGYKITVLQEKIQSVTQKCKTQLGLSATEISQRSSTVDAFFDAVAAERLRWMPRDGSRLDCSLRWASRLAYSVDALRVSVGAFAPGANEAAKMIWGFLILLLEVRSSLSNWRNGRNANVVIVRH